MLIVNLVGVVLGLAGVILYSLSGNLPIVILLAVCLVINALGVVRYLKERG